MADVKSLAESLVNLTVKEVQELAEFLKTEYGIEPAAAAVVVSAGDGGGAGAGGVAGTGVGATGAVGKAGTAGKGGTGGGGGAGLNGVDQPPNGVTGGAGTIGGNGGPATGDVASLINEAYGSHEAWAKDLKTTGIRQDWFLPAHKIM
jgi:hypothetical protein